MHLLPLIDFLTCLCFSVPQFELDGKVGCVHMLLSPDQITHLTDLLAALCIDTGTELYVFYVYLESPLAFALDKSYSSWGPTLKTIINNNTTAFKT